MGFCPAKASINELDFVEPFELLNANGKEFFGFELACDPVLWRLKVASTAFAVVDGGGLRDALSDIDLAADTGNAHVGGVRCYRSAAKTAENCRQSPRDWGGDAVHLHGVHGEFQVVGRVCG